MDRDKSIYRVTIWGGVINMALLVFKFTAGVLGHSAAMIADAVHSLSDFVTDAIVLIFVKWSNKPIDEDHDYGHGKYETLASVIISVALLIVGLGIFYNGIVKIWQAVNGNPPAQPGWIALIAALLSIVLKEWAFRFTMKVGKATQSSAVITNAWHHRSDALSSIGTAVGIGGAILLGKQWTVLDPIAAIIVSVFIVKAAIGIMKQAVDELMEKSLPSDMEEEMRRIAESEPQVSGVHNLRTRRIGSVIAIEMHVRMPGNLSLLESHNHATNIEHALKKRFGEETHVALHVEPTKVNGKYEEPEK
ncbi:MAG: cation diffusion facilitator family transporter [Prevotella sp.]|jgi:cation diffusion facilitator family transporter